VEWSEKREVNLKQPWSDLDPNYPLVGTASIIFTMVIHTTPSNLERKACPYSFNDLPMLLSRELQII